MIRDTEWYSTQLERVFCGMFIRVIATPHAQRWKWFVAPADRVAKAPHWYAEYGKGASTADARGVSSSCAKACADAEAMAKRLSIGATPL